MTGQTVCGTEATEMLPPANVDVVPRSAGDTVAMRAQMKVAMESSGACVWELDAAGGTVRTVSCAMELEDLDTRGVIDSQKLSEAIFVEDQAAFAEAVARLRRENEDFTDEFRLAQGDGTRWIRCSGRQFVDCERKGHLMITSIEITRQRWLEGEVRRLEEKSADDKTFLRRDGYVLPSQSPIIGNSPALCGVLHQTQQVATTDSTVLILGETGTGKELLAQFIHGISRRANRPFVTTNIAAIPATLLESELFGREKGAYTGALSRQIGRFEMADGGTLFIDEIGEMPLETQAKLLRVLQSGEFERLGSSKGMRVDVRVLAATNRNLVEMIKQGKFRADLYYRLNVFPLTLPSLSERREDIPLLVWAFVNELSAKMGKPIDRLRKRDLEAFQARPWPGNIRELRNAVERSMILADGCELRLVAPDSSADAGGSSPRLEDVERSHILRILKQTHGRIYGQSGAATLLDIKPTTLYSLMKRLGISREQRMEAVPQD